MDPHLIIAIVILALGALAVSFFIYKKIKNYNIGAVIIKIIASLGFVLLGVFSFYHTGRHILSIFLVTGSILGMLGDIFLGLKHVYKENSKLYVKAGFLSFALGHIFYVSGMFSEFFIPSSSFLYVLLPIVVAALLGTMMLVVEKPLKMHYGSMKIMICLYAFFLFCTPCSAFSLLVLNNFSITTLLMLAPAGFLFATSDFLLCNTYFADNRDTPAFNFINSVTYFLAQYTIAFSIFFLI